MNGVEQLCPNCGLCCDSTLFTDAELQPGDDAQRLAKLGLLIEKKGRNQLAFMQPCACFDGKLCRIYGDRPKRCRTFECSLLKRVETGGLTADAALRKISQAKKRREQVNRLLRRLGQNDGRLALMERYSAAMSAPMDLADEKNAARRGELMLAVEKLRDELQREFLDPDATFSTRSIQSRR